MTELDKVSKQILMICNDMYVKEVSEQETVERINKVIIELAEGLVPEHLCPDGCQFEVKQNLQKLTKGDK